MNYHFLIYFLLLIIACQPQAEKKCALEITQASCERLKNPMGIEKMQPRLGWQLTASCNDQQQSAYHILVASSIEKLQQNKADIWDSQKIKSSQSLNIPYQGTNLKTAHTYYWKVKVWNAQGVASEWSHPQQWTMGLISETDRQADWVGLSVPIDSASQEQKKAAHYLYTNFQTEEKTITQATAFVSGLGLFDFYVNGNLISDHRLNPANTNYFKRAIYVAFDLSQNLSSGRNAIGVVLGNGKHLLERKDRRNYGLPRLWCQVHIQYSDGSSQIIKTDGSWKISTQGPIRFNHEFDGEQYDARLGIMDWATTQMDFTNWKDVDVLNTYNPVLSAQLMPPVRVVETLSPKSIRKLNHGKFIIDFGQNITGWTTLNVKGKRGTKLKLRHAELLGELGNLDTASIRSAKATDVFILQGKDKEQFEPRFSYHGFRYVELSGLANLDSSMIQACVAHNDLKETGSFSCSNPLLNQIYQNAKWSVRGNYQHVPVDCPQRDERYGWLGDRFATAFGEAYLYDIHHFYSKWMQDIADEQLENGALSNIAPAHWEVYKDNVTWPATYIQLVGLLHRNYDDSLLVVQHYDSMHKWMKHIHENYSVENLIYCDQYGDWMVPPENLSKERNEDIRLKSSADILATTTYVLALKEMYQFAHLLSKEEDTQFYEQQIKAYQAAISDRLMDESKHSYGNHSPTEILLLLAEENLTLEHRSLLVDNLIGMLQGQYEGRMTFGLVGMRSLMKVLSDHGNIDFAYQLANERSYPSWGYMIDQGATTMWEAWTGKQDKSQNHVMLIGDLMQWFYAYLGGIQLAENGRAFDRLKLIPHLPEGLGSVNVSFQSPRGRIQSHWKKSSSNFQWMIELPVGTSAQVYLPYSASLEKRKQFLKLDTLAGNSVYAVFHLGSGQHQLTCPLLGNTKRETYSASPRISIQDAILAKADGQTHLVELTSPNPQAKIYYSLDGTDPDTSSRLYEGAFELKEYAIIKAIAKEDNKAPSYVKNSFVDVYDPKVNGWNYWYYHERLQQLPNYDTLVAVDSGRVSIIDLKKLKQRPNFWAFKFEAYLDIPKEGVYTFYLESDDGARLFVDQQEVVINDGVHYRTQRKGSIRLAKTSYRLRLEHFNWWSFNALELLVSGPDMPRQALPVSWLRFVKE